MQLLSGWKEIATHLHRGVRTVQRWELTGLPIHRVGAISRSPVIAYAEELEEWGKAAPMRILDELAELKKQVESLKVEVRILKRQLKTESARIVLHRSQTDQLPKQTVTSPAH